MSIICLADDLKGTTATDQKKNLEVTQTLKKQQHTFLFGCFSLPVWVSLLSCFFFVCFHIEEGETKKKNNCFVLVVGCSTSSRDLDSKVNRD